jgi:hypothetical protein
MSQRYAVTYREFGFENPRVIWARTYKSLVVVLGGLAFKQIEAIWVQDMKTYNMLVDMGRCSMYEN